MIVYDNAIDRLYQYLLILAFFTLPLTVLGNNIAIWLITIFWLSSGNYLKKFEKIRSNKLAIASIAFFLVHIIGLLWTEHIEWGLEILRKMLPFLLVLPVFLTISKKENHKLYILAFLFAIAISETLSYLIWFGIIEPFKYATIDNPTPIMSHISYNPFLAFAIYLVLNKLLSKDQLTQFERASYTFFVLTMTFNMFITGGRAGQVMFFVAIVLLAFQHFKNSQVKAILISIVTILLISSVSYNSSNIFKKRVDSALDNVINYQSNKDTPVGQRITFLINSYEIFNKSPLIGVGTGDFPYEYSEVNSINSPNQIPTSQPHNMYLLILAQLGLFGLISLGWIFYLQFKIAKLSSNVFIQNIGTALPFLFLVIMWSDSYLLGHYTSNLYILFSSFIYSNR
jgi:O-antigen ligase